MFLFTFCDFIFVFYFSEPFTVQVACGPYSTCDTTLSYKPLEDLLEVVAKDVPDILILVGFVGTCFCVSILPLFNMLAMIFYFNHIFYLYGVRFFV